MQIILFFFIICFFHNKHHLFLKTNITNNNIYGDYYIVCASPHLHGEKHTLSYFKRGFTLIHPLVEQSRQSSICTKNHCIILFDFIISYIYCQRHIFFILRLFLNHQYHLIYYFAYNHSYLSYLQK